MNIQAAYNTWAETYDAVLNQTRDVEATAIREMLANIACPEAIEIGCGTGKNTEWLATKATHLTAVDFSAEMLAQAQAKATSRNISFQRADITQEWRFVNRPADLITCSLVLEHVSNLSFVFQQASRTLQPAGLFYIGELHPFKQYQGSKARFDNGHGIVELECFTHHVSEYVALAKSHDFECLELREWFDDDNLAGVPRIISFLFRKSS
ncbi:methyltransferase domain-containing protein [Hymenobacter sp. BT664]|uniref:Methyltransferase domain-containing protein n=1 Tax=Hymenobacter montanus TaxID=2771359 RepID=A0A927GHT8_9BACT|nr:class I SAM-dependent methyltransferase [Hymenobacter montanus]MBD2766361.1 methyltransferase domain-containing protein [Hymenobacter montanus]